MAKHKCQLLDCDGTPLGHELARDFPEETRQVTESLERLIDTGHDFTVDPANLQVHGEDADDYSMCLCGRAIGDCTPPEPPILCPECRQGKYLNCVGRALDPDTDEFVPCEGGAS